jgi:hypothetical protein
MVQFSSGSFTSDGLPRVLDIQSGASYFKLTNVTAGQEYEWFSSFAVDSAYDITGAALISSGGISAFASQENAFGPEKTGTGVSQAAAAVVTINAHGYATGDIVRLYGTTGMRQIAGQLFQITVTGANTFTIDLDTSGFVAPATAVKARKLLVPQLIEPRSRAIVDLTIGASTTVKTSVDHGYAVGQYITLIVPVEFGSSEISGQSGRISAISSANEFVVEIDSSAASAFAYPASGSVPFTFPQAVVAGDQTTLAQGNVFPGSIRNDGIRGLALGATVVGSAADEIYWYAIS